MASHLSSQPHPEEKANFISRLTFSWVSPFIASGYEGNMSNDTLWPVAKVDSSSTIKSNIDDAIARLRAKGDQLPAPHRILWEAYGTHFIFTGFLKLINDVLVFANPILMQKLLKYLKDPTVSNINTGLCIAGLFFLCSTVQSLVMNQYFHRVLRTGIWFRSAQIVSLYRKSLHLSNSTQLRPEFHKGRLVTMMSNDAQRLQDCAFFLHLIWSSPMQFVVACVLLYIQLGWPSLLGVFLMAVLVPVNNRVMARMFKYSRQRSGHADERVKGIDECLQGIRIVKVMAWEHLFSEKLFDLRGKEIECLRKQQNLRLASFTIINLTPIVVAGIIFTLYALLGRELTAEIIFPSLALLSIVRFPLIMMPALQSSLSDTWISLKRIQAYLDCDDRTEYLERLTEAEEGEGLAAVIEKGTFHWYEGQTADGQVVTEKGQPLKWYRKAMRRLGSIRRLGRKGPAPDGKPAEKEDFRIVEKVVLQDINIRIRKGQLTFIVGETGSGKSSLLAALMGQIERSDPGCRVANVGDVAYVAQEAWIMNTTLRNNVTFQKEYDRKKYNRILDICQLRADIQQLAAGDQTEIGEKGINLSGGQKQRVALARALYADCELYLMDDPLSAVDAHVGKALFEGCICAGMKHCTRILVTHQVQFLEKADHIILVANKGIAFSGTYPELVVSGLMETLKHDAPPLPEALPEADPNPGIVVSVDDTDLSADEVDASQDDDEELIADTDRQETSHKKTKKKGRSKKKSKKEDKKTLIDQGDAELDLDGDYDDDDDDGRLSVASMDPEGMRLSIELAGERPSAEVRKDREKKDQGKLMSTETTKEGRVAGTVYASYIRAGGGFLVFAFLIIVNLTFETFKVGGDVWLSIWSAPPVCESGAPPNATAVPLTATEVPLNTTAHCESALGLGDGGYIGIYVSIVVLCGVFQFLRGYTLFAIIRSASSSLHANMLHSVLKAPMWFFDTTPHGRILNRFTKDIDSIDNTLPQSVNFAFNMIFSTFSALVIIIASQPVVIVVILALGWVYIRILKYFIVAFRDAKRLDSVNKSPIFAHYSETLNGLGTITAYNGAAAFEKGNEERLDLNIRSNFAFLACQRWLSVRLEFMCNILVAALALCAVLLKLVLHSQQSLGNVGLSIVYAVNLTSQLGFLIRQIADVEAQMNGVERVLEYTTDLPAERMLEYTDRDPAPPGDWPQKGCVTFAGVDLRYQRHLPLVLKEVSFAAEGGTKVGLVGRTGSGKSTTLLALFRLVEAEAGQILIDGVDIQRLRLEDVRSKLTIIPQDPLLFQGTIRSNLDPFDQFTDAMIWSALKQSNMHDRIADEPMKLEAPVAEGGGNFSVGQRQLLCLTRAILKDAKILCLDEATASVDRETDRLIQQTIRDTFSKCTILTIAHRLQTIADYDKIVVMDAGHVGEAGSPRELLEKKGLFYAMAQELGEEQYQKLENIAYGLTTAVPSPLTASPLGPPDSAYEDQEE